MTRLTKQGKRLPHPNGEPDFYDIARRFPLPEDSSSNIHRTNTEATAQTTLIQQNAAANNSSSPTGANEPPIDNPAPRLNRLEKHEDRDRHSFPPDGNNRAFISGYGYPLSYGYNGYAQPHYPHHHGMMYPPYPPPYNYPSPYGYQFWYHNNPYVSPQMHVSAYGYNNYNQQQYHPQSHRHPYELQNNIGPEEQHAARAGREYQLHDNHSPNVALANETGQEYKWPDSPIEFGNVQTSPCPHNAHIQPSVNHQNSANMTNVATERDHSSRMTGRQYVFPSYGASSPQGTM